MSIKAEATTSFEIVTAQVSDEKVCSDVKRNQQVRFWSLMALVSLFLVHGIWVIYDISGRQAGTIDRNVSFLLLLFYASTLPGWAYFGWGEYSSLKKS